MDDSEKQIRDFYERQSLAPERAAAILAEGRKLAAAHRRQKLFWRTAGLAAAVSLIGGLGWISLRDSTTPAASGAEHVAQAGVDLGGVQSELMAFFAQPDYELDQISLDQPQLLAYLRSRGAPEQLSVPGALDALDNLGCEVLAVQGRQVYVMCFYLDGVPRDASGQPMPGKKPMMAAAAPTDSEPVAPMMKKPDTLVHLVTIPREQFVGAPRVGDPVGMTQEGRWSFATWATEDVVYVAASPAEAERFAALARDFRSG